MYYGLNESERMTSEKIVKIFGVKCQKIDQSLNKAFKKIGRSTYVRLFAIYMDDSEKSLQYIDSFRLK